MRLRGVVIGSYIVSTARSHPNGERKWSVLKGEWWWSTGRDGLLNVCICMSAHMRGGLAGDLGEGSLSEHLTRPMLLRFTSSLHRRATETGAVPARRDLMTMFRP